MNISSLKILKVKNQFHNLILTLIFCVFSSQAFSVAQKNEVPLTAHSNYDKIITTHGGLAWTESNVFGKYILILNSHHEGDKKTDALMNGIYDKLNKYNLPLEISVEYMDIYRYPYKQHQDNLEKTYKYKYSNKRISAIITSGTEALDFALRTRPELFYNTPVVFSSSGNLDAKVTNAGNLTTGVIESIDIIETIKIACLLHPKIDTVVISSPNEYERLTAKKITLPLAKDINIDIWDDIYLSEIEKKIDGLNKNIIFLPLAEPRTKAGKNIPYDKFLQRISKFNHVRLYSLWDTALGNGIIGGKLTSAYDEGETVADIVLNIINNNNLTKVPAPLKSPNRYMFDYEQIRRFDIDTGDLPENSVIINKPFSVYETYRLEINLAIILFIFQAGIIFLLVLFNRRRIKAEKELTIVNDQLEMRVEERTKELSYQASHDALTGLINRREFEKRLDKNIESLKSSNNRYVLCYFDLDQFKVINDTCGHIAGDELLRKLGGLLQNSIRHRDTLARLGGDEFAAIIENCSLEQAHIVVNKILSIIDNFRFEWNNKTFRVSVSVGLVPIINQLSNRNELLKQADAACYVAKKEGRNRIHIYKQDDTKLARHHSEMQGILYVQDALDKNRFCLYKQNIQSINDNEYESGIHFEVLLRMQKDDVLLSPNAFMPSIEQYGLSSKVDSWVVETIFNWIKHNKQHEETLSMCSINLSGYSIVDESFLNFIINQIELKEINPVKICFEITETATIANYEKASNFIKQLRQRGCKFALDDFGSGFSSFAHLKNLHIDFLKIDGMFIRDILNDPIAYSMVKAINEISHMFGIKTIAEFVENQAIKQKLIDMKIDFLQGYHIGMPHPIDDKISHKPDKSITVNSQNKQQYTRH